MRCERASSFRSKPGTDNGLYPAVVKDEPGKFPVMRVLDACLDLGAKVIRMFRNGGLMVFADMVADGKTHAEHGQQSYCIFKRNKHAGL